MARKPKRRIEKALEKKTKFNEIVNTCGKRKPDGSVCRKKFRHWGNC